MIPYYFDGKLVTFLMSVYINKSPYKFSDGNNATLWNKNDDVSNITSINLYKSANNKYLYFIDSNFISPFYDNTYLSTLDHININRSGINESILSKLINHA